MLQHIGGGGGSAVAAAAAQRAARQAARWRPQLCFSAKMEAAAQQRLQWQSGGDDGNAVVEAAACYKIRVLWYLLTVLTYQSHVTTL